MGKTYKDREKKDNISRVNNNKKNRNNRVEESIFGEDIKNIQHVRGINTIFKKRKK
jgi:hypothetical protein